MISLKTICTSLKRSSLFLIMFFALLLPMSGASFRVAIVSEESRYSSLITDVLSVFSNSVSSDYALNLLNKRIDRELKNTYNTSLDRYLKAENFNSINNLELSTSSEIGATLEVVAPTLSEVETRYILSSDIDAIEYIKLRDNYDMVISIVLVDNDLLPQIALYIDGELKREALYSDLLRDVEEEFLFNFFSSLLISDSYKLVKIALPTTGTIYVDDVQVSLYTSRIVLTKGAHTISYIVPGYISKSMDVIIDDTTDNIELALEELPPASLHITSVPYDVAMFYNGIPLEDRVIDNLVYPFTITATHEDFSLYSMQSMIPMENLTISLKPSWLDSENILEEAKGDFYMNLFITLMTFGGSVAAGTVSNLLPEYDLGPVSVVLGGISLVSLINMVDSMFEYFDSARNGI